jgi:hypothetical protein
MPSITITTTLYHVFHVNASDASNAVFNVKDTSDKRPFCTAQYRRSHLHTNDPSYANTGTLHYLITALVPSLRINDFHTYIVQYSEYTVRM